MKNKDNTNNKSQYWKQFKDQYTIDENGKVIIHDDASDEVKKSYKQYTYEMMMGNYFEEEEEVEETIERTFSISEDTLASLNKKSDKIEIKELKLKKDYSMYSWMSYKEYYDVVDGKYVFKENTPQEILDNYKRYEKQLNRIDHISDPKADNIFDHLLKSTGLNTLFKKKKK